MSLTTLDPKSALVVVDLQKGIAALPTAHPMDRVVENAAALAAAFRRHELPVILVNVAGTPPGRTERPRPALARPDGWTDLLPELNRAPQDHLVTKSTPGAFTATDLEAYLKALGMTQVVVVGVATSVGVEVTARQAYERGFNVTLATDAMTDMAEDAHTWSITRVFPRIGESGTTRQVVELLDATRQA